MIIPDSYRQRVASRSFLRYAIGYCVRLGHYVKYDLRRRIARLGGAKIGKNSLIPWKLARMANANLEIGDDVSINSSGFDLRGKIIIKDNVIINRDVEIIRWSHDYNSPDFKLRKYPPLVIEPYTWLATGCKILPSCTKVAYGSVIGAFSVVVKDTEENGVYSGFPAQKIRSKTSVWSDLVIVSMNAGDWQYYRKAKCKQAIKEAKM